MSRLNEHNVRGWSVVLTEFSLREISVMAEVSPTYLMVWRNRGHLPGTRDTSGTFTSRDAAEILVRQCLTEGNLAPGQSRGLGAHGADAVLWYAVVNHEGVCEIWGTDSDTAHCQAEFEKNTDLAGEILRFEETPPGYIWRDGSKTPTLEHDVSSLLANSTSRTHFIVDLGTIASDMVRLANRPLFSINASPGSKGKMVRRFSRISSA